MSDVIVRAMLAHGAAVEPSKSSPLHIGGDCDVTIWCRRPAGRARGDLGRRRVSAGHGKAEPRDPAAERDAAALVSIVAKPKFGELSSDEHFWNRRNYRLGTVSLVITVVVGVGGIFIPQMLRDRSPEDRLLHCQKEPWVPSGVRSGIGKHVACAWPPPLGAEEDGYTVVDVQGLAAPGRASADEDAVVWIFTSMCRRLAMDWRLDCGGDGGISAVFNGDQRYANGQVLDSGGSPTRVPDGLEGAGGGRADGRLIITQSGHVYPADVTCAAAIGS